MTHRTGNKAFTLIELLVVIAILGVLFVVGSYAIGSATASSRNNTRKQDLKHIQTALEQYATDQRSYPVLDAQSVAGKPVFDAAWQLTASPSCGHSTAGAKYISPAYLSTVPEDPQNSTNFTALNCTNALSANQTTRYLYITDVTSSTSSTAASYGLLTTLERVTVDSSKVINGNLNFNSPYATLTANPFTDSTSPFDTTSSNFYSNNATTGATPNFMIFGGATR